MPIPGFEYACILLSYIVYLGLASQATRSSSLRDLGMLRVGYIRVDVARTVFDFVLTRCFERDYAG
jgi:hypothetical protein